jgi:hypothetical protein
MCWLVEDLEMCKDDSGCRSPAAIARSCCQDRPGILIEFETLRKIPAMVDLIEAAKRCRGIRMGAVVEYKERGTKHGAIHRVSAQWPRDVVVFSLSACSRQQWSHNWITGRCTFRECSFVIPAPWEPHRVTSR